MSLDVSLHIKDAKGDSLYVHSDNITHNLNTMAEKAGLYEYLWRPDEIGLLWARELIQPLKDGLAELLANPEQFKAFNPSNGWGDYAGLVKFVTDYLDACERWPDSEISISR